MSIASSWKVPGITLSVVFGAGTSSPLNAPRKVLLIDLGTAGTVNIVKPLFSGDTASTEFGDGSNLHLGAIAALKADPACSLYGVRMATSNAAVARVQTYTLTGTASANGAHQLVWNGVYPILDVPVASGATVTTQATALAAAINARKGCPVTATSLAGVVTLTAKCPGVRGQQFTISVLASPPGTTGVLAETTAGTGESDPTAALDAITGMDFDYIATGDTALAQYVRRAEDRAGPLAGMRGAVVGATAGSYATAVALSLAVNGARGQVVACRNAQMTSIEMAAAMAATRAANPINANFDGMAIAGWRGPVLDSDVWLLTEQNAMLNAGTTPIVSGAIVRSVTTRWQDTLGGPDYRVLDTIKQEVPDYIADLITAQWRQLGYNSYLAKDDTSADGTDTNVPDGVLTPRHLRGWLNGLLRGAERQSFLKNVAANEPNVKVTYGTIAVGRFDATIPVDVIDQAHILDGVVNQVG
jgi:phage tail sheath gpL-like